MDDIDFLLLVKCINSLTTRKLHTMYVFKVEQDRGSDTAIISRLQLASSPTTRI